VFPRNDLIISVTIYQFVTAVRRAIDIVINKIGQSEAFVNSNMTRTDMKKLMLTVLNNNNG